MHYALTLGLVVFFSQQLFRLTHLMIHYSELSAIDALYTILIGMRFDAVTGAYAMLASLICHLMVPRQWTFVQKTSQYLLTAAILLIVLFLEIASFPFFAEYGLRPNRLMIEYLQAAKEVSATVFTLYGYHFLGAGILIAIAIFATITLMRFTQNIGEKFSSFALPVRLMALTIFVGILILLGRGGIPYGRSITVDRAVFGNNEIANQLALNSTFTLSDAIMTALYEKSPTAEYDRISLSDEQVFNIAKGASLIPPQDFVNDPQNPLLHHVKPLAKAMRGRNLVILLEESLGAEYVGSLGGPPLTPNFDALAKTGLFLRQLYSTGTRSARGIEAVISGFLPTPGLAVIKLGLAQKDFFTVGSLMANLGYDTSFIYGGDSAFDNMRTFASRNGFNTIVDQQDYPAPNFKGIWGVSDEDLFIKANDRFKSLGDQPFFSLVFSSSNHGPFEFPDGKIELYEQPKGTINNAIKYADYSVGRFFEMAKKEAYYKNTVFVVLADHNWRNFGSNLIPVDKMHIPGFIIAPDLAPQNYDKPCSQIDVLPTALSLLGLDMQHPMIGHNILNLPSDYPGRAILQYDKNNGYILGQDIVIHTPHKSPKQFTIQGANLVPNSERNPKLIDEASAHALLPGILYQKRLYHAAKATGVATLR